MLCYVMLCCAALLVAVAARQTCRAVEDGPSFGTALEDDGPSEEATPHGGKRKQPSMDFGALYVAICVSFLVAAAVSICRLASLVQARP
jgi:hypothetical protein